MASGRHWEQDKEATVYVGNLDERVTDHLVWELMLQAGRIVNVHLPKDRVSQIHQGYGFVEFISEEDADYAAKIMNQVRLYGKPIRVNKASADKQKSVEVGAELFVGNLDAMVDERTLYETFSRFGTLINPPKVARDDANLSKGYGFVSFADFDASDNAIANMHGQYLMNKEISVQYAYKKDGKGERHGDEAERMLAAQARKNNVQINHQPLNPQLFQAQGPNAPPPMANGAPNAMPLGFGGGGGGPPQRPMQTTPLPPAPSSLPSRPPPSQAGYGGPAAGLPPGFAPQQAPPQGFPGQMPPGYGGYPPQPPGFGAAPPGMHMQMGAPPGMPPPGYPQAYGR